MTPRVVYDTNVVVSAVLKRQSVPALLMTFALNNRVKLSISKAIIEEYEAVLKRPKFGFPPEEVDALLRNVRAVSLRVFPTAHLEVCPHKPDNRFLECAYKAGAEYLVTGNKKHFPFPEFRRIKIVSPAEFMGVITDSIDGE